MGARGPKPLPKNIHLITGNRAKIPLGKLNASIQPDTDIPDCPAHLLPEAKKEWKRIVPELEKMRIISEMDRSALAVYCQAFARWVQAEKKLKSMSDDSLVDETPSGYKQISVWLQISNRSVEQMHKFLCEFGMSPSSRSRVTANAQIKIESGDNEKSRPDRFFGGK